MGLTDKIKNFIAPEEDEELELSSEEVKSLSQYENPRSKEATGAANNYNIVLFEPRSYNEATEVADHLKSRRACAINLHRMPADYRQRHSGQGGRLGSGCFVHRLRFKFAHATPSMYLIIVT